MTVTIRCREDHLYQFSNATCSFLEHGFCVRDRFDTEHFYPYPNLIKCSIKPDDDPKSYTAVLIQDKFK